MSDSESFDAYHKWLGIPPKAQPPNHYRLLSVELLEHDADVIEAAASRVSSYLHDLASGPNRDDAQRLLNEVAKARRCLVDPARKAEYDKTLQPEVAATSPEAAPDIDVGATQPLVRKPVVATTGETSNLHWTDWRILTGGGILAVAVIIILAATLPGGSDGEDVASPNPVGQASPSNQPFAIDPADADVWKLKPAADARAFETASSKDNRSPPQKKPPPRRKKRPKQPKAASSPNSTTTAAKPLSPKAQPPKLMPTVFQSGLPTDVERKAHLQFWNGVKGPTVKSLTETIKRRPNPNGEKFLETLSDTRNTPNFGQRISGLLLPPATGVYEFEMTFDDAGTVFLSADKSPSSRIVLSNGKTVHLVADGAYYFTILHKNSKQTASFTIGWTLPDGTKEMPIPSTRLAWSPHKH